MSPDEKNLDDRLQALIKCLSYTRENEADCAEFNIQQDCLAEMLAAGYPADEVLPPEVEAHLANSTDCREEFEALISVLRAEMAGELPDDID